LPLSLLLSGYPRYFGSLLLSLSHSQQLKYNPHIFYYSEINFVLQKKKIKKKSQYLPFKKNLNMLLNNFSSFLLETGTDEAGRGCLAGPVTAAAVILPLDFKNTILNDSKQLSEKAREKLRPIIEQEAITFAVTHLYPNEIDEINILNASMKGMQECILKLNQTPEFIIVDGNRSLNAKLGLKNNFGKKFSKVEIELLKSIPNQSIIKGDSKYLSIAAASVLAKNLSG
jgi:ribonuclease HII